jgi:hypothetical protein
MKIEKTTLKEKVEYQKDFKISVNNRINYVTAKQLKDLIQQSKELIRAQEDEELLQGFTGMVWEGVYPKDEQVLIDKYLNR